MVNMLQNNAHTCSNGSVPDFHEGPVIGKKAAAKAKASPEGRIAAKQPMGQCREPPVYPDGSSSKDTDEENIVKPKNKELRFADPDLSARRLNPNRPRAQSPWRKQKQKLQSIQWHKNKQRKTLCVNTRIWSVCWSWISCLQSIPDMPKVGTSSSIPSY